MAGAGRSNSIETVSAGRLNYIILRNYALALAASDSALPQCVSKAVLPPMSWQSGNWHAAKQPSKLPSKLQLLSKLVPGCQATVPSQLYSLPSCQAVFVEFFVPIDRSDPPKTGPTKLLPGRTCLASHCWSPLRFPGFHQ